MSVNKFINLCKKQIVEYYALNNVYIGTDNVVVVWQCKTLQNIKATLIGLHKDNLYFECTYNGDKNELYVDVYDKIDKIVLREVF